MTFPDRDRPYATTAIAGIAFVLLVPVLLVSAALPRRVLRAITRHCSTVMRACRR